MLPGMKAVRRGRGWGWEFSYPDREGVVLGGSFPGSWVKVWVIGRDMELKVRAEPSRRKR